MNVLFKAAFIVIIFYLTSCASGKLYINSDADVIQARPLLQPDFTIYALGDGGEINNQSKAVISQLTKLIADDNQPGYIIFLGDNIYPAGMPPEGNIKGYQNGQEILMNQLAGLSSYDGRVIFIPGNHDWNEFKPGGLEAIKRQWTFLNALDFPHVSMLPENGCAGPVALDMNENSVLIIIDSQWWIQDWNKEPGINEGCTVGSRENFITAFHQLVKKNKDKQLVIAMHHPLFTQGAHGGHFTVRDHLFPLSKAVHWLYVPLPVIGSIYPLFRSIVGHPQDIKHRGYRTLKEGILHDLDYSGEMIFLAGHDHNIQYIVNEDDHFLLSGSVSKKNAVANSKNLVYGHMAAGFMQMDFYEGAGVFLTIYEVDPGTGSIRTVFSRSIIEK